MADFERSCQGRFETWLASGPIPERNVVLDEMCQATRALLGATTPAQLADVVVTAAPGGAVNVGSAPHSPGTVTLAMPVDGRGEMGDSGGAMIEHRLARSLDDATAARARLAVEHPPAGAWVTDPAPTVDSPRHPLRPGRLDGVAQR